MLMNQPNQIKVKYNNEIHGNFIRIPSAIADGIYMSQVKIQQFRFKIQDKWYLSWDGFESNDSQCIEINPVLGNTLNLIPDKLTDFAIEQFLSNDIVVHEVYVKPLTSDDWEIAESNSRYLQDEILNQTKIVNIGGIIVCYVGNSICKFSVDKIVPESLNVGILGDGSMIIVEPMENKLRNKTLNGNSRTEKEQIVPTLKRALCWNYLIDTPAYDEILNSMTIYINKNELKSKFAYLSIVESNLEKDKSIIHSTNSKNKSQKSQLQFAKRLLVTTLPFPEDETMLPRNHIILSKMIWNSLILPNNDFPNNGTKIKLEFVLNMDNIDNYNPEDNKLTITYLGKDNVKVRELIPKCLLHSNMIVTNNQIFKKENLIVEFLDSKGSHVQHVNMTTPKNEYSNIIYKMDTDFSVKKLESSVEIPKLPYIKINNTIDEMKSFLLSPVVPSPAVLIEGSFGVGKTTLLSQLSLMTKGQNTNHVRYIDCEVLQDSFSFDKLKKFVTNDICALSYWYQPTIILLDNADFVFSKSGSSNGEGGAKNDNSLSNKITHFLINEINLIFKKRTNSIRLVFCSIRKESLNNILFEKHFISKIWSIKPPLKQERNIIINKLIEHRNIELDPKLNVNDIAMETEGYSPLDLINLLNRIFYEHQINRNSPITRKCFQRVNKDFTPLFLQNVKLANNGSSSDSSPNTQYRWENIGGLVDAKKILLETLEWPVKYAPIFQNSPLRLRSGILIYGYPGCGKTLLANTISLQCGLNFIPVKGPEILNKYIGASEQNVRELFERAESVKPCILFFDEFDSIATKRGHDSTGVTDRVVNQLLTQMDGAEGLDGVYVVAATSRPDLIDPALLRPGRLDKSIFCSLPDASERFDIMKCILEDDSNKIKFNTEQGISKELLNVVINMTEGYSGADIQGLYYNAYLKAVHRNLDNKLSSNDSGTSDENNDHESVADIQISVINGDDNDDKLLRETVVDQLQKNAVRSQSKEVTTQDETKIDLHITLQDLLESCQETKPSISVQELEKLSGIYHKFQGIDRPGDLPNGEGSMDIGTRSSLM